MKTAILCAVCGGFAFLTVQYQMTGQFFGFGPGLGAKVEPPPPKAKFPEALAAACRGVPVPQAASFNRTAEMHAIVVLKPSGAVHSWNERLQPGWQAESVEETELVVVVPPQKKTVLTITTYPNGAPPIKRYQYDLDVR